MDFKNLLAQLDHLNESGNNERPYICVHAKKGKCNVKASSSYEAAKKAAEKWGLKSTAGIDSHLADSPKDTASLEEGIMDDPETTDTPTGRIHKAKPGGYGRKDDTDDEGKKVKGDAPKRGRGRPKKGADSETGEVQKYDWSAFGGPKPGSKKDIKLPKWDKSKTTKHSLKEWVEEIENQYMAEEVDTGQYDARKTTPSSKEKQDAVHAKHRERMKKLRGEMDDEDKKQGVAEGSYDTPKLGTVKANLMHTQEPTVQVQVFKHNTLRGDSYWVTKEVRKFKTMDQAQVYVDRINKQGVAEGSLNELSKDTLKSYARKAVPDMQASQDKAKAEHSKAAAAKDDKDAEKHYDAAIQANDRTEKRMAGVAGAIKRLNKEGVAEAEQIQIKPASQIPRQPGTSSISAPTQNQTVAGQSQKNTQVIQQGSKTLGTVDNPQLAQQIKQSIGKGEMTLMPEEEMAEANYSAKAARAGKDIGKPGKNFAKIAKSAGEKYGSQERGEKVAGAILAKLRSKQSMAEGDIPADQMDMGAGLGKGRNQKTLEAKAKLDFLDLDKDGNKKESMKKAFMDKKKNIKESSHRYSSAKLLGKSHALAKEGYNCKYDDLEEARLYHEGYKEGLDECYGQGMYNTTNGLQSSMGYDIDQGMDEGNAFTAKLARTPKGSSFSLGNKTFIDRTSYDAAFESLDNQLKALLENNDITEGMSVSISKGQQNLPDTVTVSAQDAEADQLLSLIKQSGLGLFGNDNQGGYDVSSDTGISHQHDGIEVVDDNDSIMSLIKKVTGADMNVDNSSDYADETDVEDTCDSCGQSSCQCDQEMHSEDETYDQEEEEVAEDNLPDSDEAETSSDENAEASEDDALADDEEQVTEWANDSGEAADDYDDESFTTDTEFMNNVITGGLNKKKVTGQTTLPVIAGQDNRMVAHESISDLKKLAGI